MRYIVFFSCITVALTLFCYSREKENDVLLLENVEALSDDVEDSNIRIEKIDAHIDMDYALGCNDVRLSTCASVQDYKGIDKAEKCAVFVKN